MTKAAAEAKEKPHYHGHRQHWRERFFASGVAELKDYELMERLLFAAIPR